MNEIIIGLLGAIMLYVTFVNIRGFRKQLGMNIVQSFTMGVLTWIPLAILIAMAIFALGTELVLLAARLIANLLYRLVCGLSGTSVAEVHDLHKSYLQKLGKK